MPGKLLPLVLVHGYPLDHSMWYGVIAALGSGVRTVAPDLRGFGKSGEPQGEPSLEAMADDVLAGLKRDKIEKFVVAGMSMGGYVALAMAEMAPQKIAGLALVNSQSFADTDEVRAGRREMIARVRAEGPQAAARAAIPRMFAPGFSDNPDYQRFIVEGVEKAGVAGICWALEAMARRPDRSAVIEDANFPVLILHSAEDRFIPVEKARQMASLQTDPHFVVVPNAGHAAALEAPDQVGVALRKFLQICSEASEAAARPPQ